LNLTSSPDSLGGFNADGGHYPHYQSEENSMITLELDDETATLLNQLVEQEHLSPAQLVKNVLYEHLEDCQDAKKADEAYQRYLEGGKISHSLDGVVKELGLDS
jgi:predicted DNA-binding protein